jgi:hypothetical protein
VRGVLVVSCVMEWTRLCVLCVGGESGMGTLGSGVDVDAVSPLEMYCPSLVGVEQC